MDLGHLVSFIDCWPGWATSSKLLHWCLFVLPVLWGSSMGCVLFLLESLGQWSACLADQQVKKNTEHVILWTGWIFSFFSRRAWRFHVASVLCTNLREPEVGYCCFRCCCWASIILNFKHAIYALPFRKKGGCGGGWAVKPLFPPRSKD